MGYVFESDCFLEYVVGGCKFVGFGGDKIWGWFCNYIMWV